MEAAKHVLQDLDQHGLLRHLLHGSAGRPDPSTHSKPCPGPAGVSSPKRAELHNQGESLPDSSSSRQDSQGAISSFPVSPSSTGESEDGFEHESPAGHDRGERLLGEKTRDTSEGTKVDSRYKIFFCTWNVPGRTDQPASCLVAHVRHQWQSLTVRQM